MNMNEWRDNNFNDRDDNSFEDSERFEDDSQFSNESMEQEANQNWRGWNANLPGVAIQPGVSIANFANFQHPSQQLPNSYAEPPRSIAQKRNAPGDQKSQTERKDPKSLLEMAAKVCGEKVSFVELEQRYQAVMTLKRGYQMTSSLPEKLFLYIVPHTFTKNVEELCMYSTLANGGSDQYTYGYMLYQMGTVRNVVQIGFLLTGDIRSQTNDVNRGRNEACHVSIRVDRCRIIESNCSNRSCGQWCQHVVALAMFRIFSASQVQFRMTIWDSVNDLELDKLRKFTQYLINELPQEYLPIAQKYLDDLKNPKSDINQTCGAPDPTDGGHEPIAFWSMDEVSLHENIQRLFCKFIQPAPAVHCDVVAMSNLEHPTTVEWNMLIKPLRSREPEGIWNLLAMVREMMVKSDENSITLLRVITEECMSNTELLIWWYVSKMSQTFSWYVNLSGKTNGAFQHTKELNCANILDEVVNLWKCAAINPRADNQYRTQLAAYLQHYHRCAVIRIYSKLSGGVTDMGDVTEVVTVQQPGSVYGLYQKSGIPLSAANATFNLKAFPGFFPALQMCHALCDVHFDFGLPSTAIFNYETPKLNKMVSMVVPDQTRKRKSKKKKKRRNSDDFDDEPSTSRSVQWQVEQNGRNVQVEMFGVIKREDESTESGQESDVQNSSRSDQSAGSSSSHHQTKQEAEIDEVFAAAYQPMDSLEARTIKCEAFATHGYLAKASEEGYKQTKYIIDQLNDLAVRVATVVEHVKRINIKSSSPEQKSSTTEQKKETYSLHFHLSSVFLRFMEKALYTAKVMQESANHYTKMFRFVTDVLMVNKYPMYAKYQQVKLFHYESELIAMLHHAMSLNKEEEKETLRRMADKLIDNANTQYNTSLLPSVSVTKYIFERLHNGGFTNGNGQHNTTPEQRARIELDSEIALKMALLVLGWKPDSLELFTMHSESIRRQKGELAMTLLVRFKDSSEKLGLVLDKLLDPSLHRMYPFRKSNAAYFIERDPILSRHCAVDERPVYPYHEIKQEPGSIYRNKSVPLTKKERSEVKEKKKQTTEEVPNNQPPAHKSRERQKAVVRSPPRLQSRSHDSSVTVAALGTESIAVAVKKPIPDTPARFIVGLTKNNAAALLQSRGIDLRQRKNFKRKQYHSASSHSVTTEAHIHFLNDLAKKVLAAAGGNMSPDWFAHAPAAAADNNHASNRKLHLCAIVIGVYAQGLQNRISPSWNSRTYSTTVSWLNTQVLEVGQTALEFVAETWMAHFTPSEAAVMAEQGNGNRDPAVREQAAKLALGVLSYSQSLSCLETETMLEICKRHSGTTNQASLLAIEDETKCTTIYPEVLFRMAREWMDLYGETEIGAVAAPLVVREMQFGNQYQHHQRQPAYQPNNQYPIRNAPVPLMPQVQEHVADVEIGHWDPQQQHHQQPQPLIQQHQQQHNRYQGRRQQLRQQQQQPFRHHQHQPQMDYTPVQHDSRSIHHSRSAPHLGSQQRVPVTGPNDMDLHPMLTSVFRCGLRALECSEEKLLAMRQVHLSEELNWLYQIAVNLGVSYIWTLLDAIARRVRNPTILHQFAVHSAMVFPQGYVCSITPLPSKTVPPQSVPGPPSPQIMMQQTQNVFFPQVSTQPTSSTAVDPPVQVPISTTDSPSVQQYNNHRMLLSPSVQNNVIFTTGVIRSAFSHNGFQEITGELFERACERYYAETVRKMSHATLTTGEIEVLRELLSWALQTIKWIPSHISRNVFDDYIRHVKKQRSYRKEVAQMVLSLAEQYFS